MEYQKLDLIEKIEISRKPVLMAEFQSMALLYLITRDLSISE